MMKSNIRSCGRESRQRLLPILVIGLAVGLLGAGAQEPVQAQDAKAQDAKTVTITPKGNQLLYADTSFTARPGERVHLVFNNTATSAAMKHNVVILNEPPAQKLFRKVGLAGRKAGAKNDYVPQGHPAVLAHTALAEPGETVEVTFTAPEEAGKYGYVCTFTGHWTVMQGTMNVEKKESS